MHSAGSNGKSRGRLSSGGWTPTVLHNFTGGPKDGVYANGTRPTPVETSRNQLFGAKR